VIPIWRLRSCNVTPRSCKMMSRASCRPCGRLKPLKGSLWLLGCGPTGLHPFSLAVSYVQVFRFGQPLPQALPRQRLLSSLRKKNCRAASMQTERRLEPLQAFGWHPTQNDFRDCLTMAHSRDGLHPKARSAWLSRFEFGDRRSPGAAA
jgi:hypothetical protein